MHFLQRSIGANLGIFARLWYTVPIMCGGDRMFFRTLSMGVLALALPSQISAEMIHLFARQGNVDKVMAEIAKGVDPDLPSTRNTTEVGVSPLFIAAKFGRLDVVRALVEAGADTDTLFSDPASPYPYGTALYVAAAWGKSDVVSYLLEAGSDPNAFHRLMGTPLQASKEAGHDDITDMLLAAGAIPKVHAAPIDDLIREADVSRGEELAGTCRSCHSMTTVQKEGSYPAPPLWGIVGSDIAALEFAYSEAMTEETGTWTYAALNSYIASPYRFMPGTKMYFGGVVSAEERAAIIAYLRTLSDDPVPLP